MDKPENPQGDKVKSSSRQSEAIREGWGLGKPSRGFEGFREARLFSGKDRATVTFFTGQEVASIHYDMGRNEIFYRGHNVKNMTLNPEQGMALEKFSEFLRDEGADENLLQAYQDCLAKILPKTSQ